MTKSNKRGGRPRKLPEEQRVFSLRPGFTEAEFRLLENRAAAAGVDPAELARRLLLNQQIVAVPSINREAFVELNKIGTNLNQIARKLNSNLVRAPDDQVVILLERLDADINRFGASLLGD